MSWSGGKDSALALYRLTQQGLYRVDCLLTSMNAAFGRVSMHGLRRELLESQAAALGIALRTLELPEQPDMPAYEQAMQDQISQLASEGFTHGCFGDIFLEDLRDYRERSWATANLQSVFPLWKNNSTELMNEFIRLGFRALVICVNETLLDRSFCGRELDPDFLLDLPASVDPCGENGEYHSFVYDGPLFSRPVGFRKGEQVFRPYPAPAGPDALSYGFYYQDLLGDQEIRNQNQHKWNNSL
jgi:uncharacterized protein (TIGR00290 family)